MVRFPWASSKNLQRASSYFQIAKQRQGEIMRRTERRNREKQNREPQGDLQHFDVLSHHSHLWDHDKVSQLSWGHLPNAPS